MLVEHQDPPIDDGETLNTVLAEQARSRPSAELWRTTLGGGINAVLLWTQFPSLHWLASSFTAVAAYGLWGLLDHYIGDLELKNDQVAERAVARALRMFMGVGGWAAGLLAVITFMTFLVHGWIS